VGKPAVIHNNPNTVPNDLRFACGWQGTRIIQQRSHRDRLCDRVCPTTAAVLFIACAGTPRCSAARPGASAGMHEGPGPRYDEGPRYPGSYVMNYVKHRAKHKAQEWRDKYGTRGDGRPPGAPRGCLLPAVPQLTGLGARSQVEGSCSAALPFARLTRPLLQQRRPHGSPTAPPLAAPTRAPGAGARVAAAAPAALRGPATRRHRAGGAASAGSPRLRVGAPGGPPQVRQGTGRAAERPGRHRRRCPGASGCRHGRCGLKRSGSSARRACSGGASQAFLWPPAVTVPRGAWLTAIHPIPRARARAAGPLANLPQAQ
jgi:hypothetical protein